jgi:hypothetical protein
MENVPCFGTYPSLSAAYRRARNLVVAMHCYRLFVSVPTDINRKNRVLDQITACHHPQTAPTDCFLYTRASASMVGAKDHVRDTEFQYTPNGLFPPGLLPITPSHLNFAAQTTSRWPLHCCKRIAFNASTCPEKNTNLFVGSSCSSPAPASN